MHRSAIVAKQSCRVELTYVVGEREMCKEERHVLTLLEPQSRSGDNPVKFQVVLSPNGTAVLKGLKDEVRKTDE